MPRFFIELAYKGTNYSGFQTQKNANTVQAEVEEAFRVLQKEKVVLVGSSRTDAGVHARQNFFHFDYLGKIHPQFVYKMNAILPADIVIRKCIPVSSVAHCRFDAISRLYRYYIYRRKDPFLQDRAYYFPFTLDTGKMIEAAEVLKEFRDFTSFSKRKTQVKNFDCTIYESRWEFTEDLITYHVCANRFLRGMVKGLVATMLLIGRGKLNVNQLIEISHAQDCELANFTAPSHGLFLEAVNFPERYFSGV